jgi:hypothetical protein
MQIIDIKKFESKEPAFDQKSGKKKRTFPSFIAKCKWYHPKAEKYSEKFFPLEVLNLLPQYSDKQLTEINKWINEMTFLKLKEGVRETVFKPKDLLFKSGYYYLSGFNFLTNKTETVELTPENIFEKLENPFIDKWPFFNGINKSLKPEYFVSAHEKTGNYIRIKYRSMEGIITKRTIKNYTLVDGSVFEEEKEKKVIYLKGYCYLRNSERHFRLDRVLSIEALNLTFKK